MNLSVIVGLLLMVVSEAATLLRIEPFYSWNTPICWTGFILFADGLVFRARGRSWIRSSPAEFAFLTLASIPLWLIFEFYNLYIDNWYYTGLPENPWLRTFGYAWSFATIWPAIFEAADLFDVWRRRRSGAPSLASNVSSPSARSRGSALDAEAGVPALLSVGVGAAMLLWPLIWPSQYLAAPVWLGFIFLLDPINVRLGGESLFDRRNSMLRRAMNLVLAGFLCGVLWEFWNYWAGAKWHYTVPIMENVKVFEMPVPGYLGFPAFALECFTMYVFLRIVVIRISSAASRRFTRPIALS
jgi:hypothetical protein